MTTGKSMFCFGLGYSARALTESLRDDSWSVAGTARKSDSHAGLAMRGGPVHQFERSRALVEPARALAGVSHLLVSVPPDAEGDPVIECHGVDIESVATLSWIGYLSTVGVYGDWQGGWVDESLECRPVNERSRRRLSAERAWLELGRRAGVPVQIFRLAGIYGPGRNPIDSARNGASRRIFKAGQVFSRVHVADIVQVLCASMQMPNAGAIYNVCDDEPAPPQDVVAYACELVGCEVPPLIPLDEADLSPMGRSFYAECKRVRNDRIKDELGVTLRYPDYRSGLDALATS